ncbi:hypothetical protein [Trinickia sp. Y13]|uniref:hypothetical protein n=1 Tax=Trinickia sp. Y13 TaxID=2917807 RepID=UPI002404D7DE|nr:hypothetical protein [Trinickia sp. Y13]MDG0023010.1 hypothetical protein [Trinickia sp. Y13]
MFARPAEAAPSVLRPEASRFIERSKKVRRSLDNCPGRHRFVGFVNARHQLIVTHLLTVQQVAQASLRLIEQHEVRVLDLQRMVVVQLLGIDERNKGGGFW